MTRSDFRSRAQAVVNWRLVCLREAVLACLDVLRPRVSSFGHLAVILIGYSRASCVDGVGLLAAPAFPTPSI
jgi:hypothetical protein